MLAATAARSEVELVRPEETLLALFTLETQSELENQMLASLRAAYRDNLEERDRFTRQLDQLYSELEAALGAPGDEFDADDVAQRDRELERLEKGQMVAWDEGRRLRQQMLDARARLALLQDKIDGLLGSLPDATESLTGYWDVVFVPGEQRGVFFLNHSAAILTGEYALEGGFHGSLQGTIIDQKVVLHRIDSRLGRVMDLDGTLSGDGQSIKGVWRRFDLSDGRQASGAWSATRRVSSGSGEQP
jgi:hypothetical protein